MFSGVAKGGPGRAHARPTLSGVGHVNRNQIEQSNTLLKQSGAHPTEQA